MFGWWIFTVTLIENSFKLHSHSKLNSNYRPNYAENKVSSHKVKTPKMLQSKARCSRFVQVEFFFNFMADQMISTINSKPLKCLLDSNLLIIPFCFFFSLENKNWIVRMAILAYFYRNGQLWRFLSDYFNFFISSLRFFFAMDKWSLIRFHVPLVVP